MTRLVGPLSDYLGKKIEGLTVKAEKVSAGVRPLNLEARGVVLSYKKEGDAWEIRIPECRLFFDWSLTWENLPWPEIRLTRISVMRPHLVVTIPHPKKKGDWTLVLRKVPRFESLEVRDLKGEVIYGSSRLRFAQGIGGKVSFDPEEGGRLEFQGRKMEGRIGSGGLSFLADAEGELELSGFPETPRFRGGLRLAQGEWTGAGGRLKGISGSFAYLWEKDKRWLSIRPLRFREIAWEGKGAAFSGKGEWSLKGELLGQGPGGKPFWILKGVEGRGEAEEFRFEQGKKKIQGGLKGEARLEGALEGPRIAARVVLRQTDFRLPPVDTQGLEAEIGIKGQGPDLSLTVTQAQALQTDWLLGPRPLTLIRPQARFSGEIQGKKRTIFLKDIRLATANWGTLTGDLFFDLKKDPVPEGKAQAEGFPLPRFLAHFLPQADEPFRQEIPCRGTFRWRRAGKGAPLDFKVSLQPPVFSFKVPRTDWEGEGVRISIETEGRWFIEDRRVQLDLVQDWTQGALSLSPWFFDFHEQGMQSRFQGWIDGRKATAAVQGVLDLAYPPLGEVRLSVDWPFLVHPPSVSGEVEVKGLPLEKGFPLLVGKPLSYRHPFLEKLSLQGLLDGRAAVKKDDKGLELKGSLHGRDVRIGWKDPALSVEEVDLDLPFRYRSASAERKGGEGEERGFLRMGVLKTPWFVLPPISLPFSLNGQDYRFSEAIKVPLWGGEVVLSSLKVGDLFRGFRMEGNVSLNELKLEEMLKKEGVVGSLSGAFGPIRLDRERVEVEGAWKASVFEGTVEGKNLWVRKPFDPERRIGGEMDFSGLNLEVITRLFSFGRITGFLEGQVKDLVLKGTMPERFRLYARTEERPGVKKRINVTAIENIGLLGTGWGEMDTLRKGINRFITEYAYREIGLACSLEDDRFTLRGTILENGVEYLVRKPALWGIDVINKNPNNEILFSDIIERLNRIQMKGKKGTRYEVE